MKRGNPAILVVDDLHDDRLLLIRAFSKCSITGIALPMTCSGNEAVAYLSGIELSEDRNEYP